MIRPGQVSGFHFVWHILQGCQTISGVPEDQDSLSHNLNKKYLVVCINRIKFVLSIQT